MSNGKEDKTIAQEFDDILGFPEDDSDLPEEEVPEEEDKEKTAIEGSVPEEPEEPGKGLALDSDEPEKGSEEPSEPSEGGEEVEEPSEEEKTAQKAAQEAWEQEKKGLIDTVTALRHENRESQRRLETISTEIEARKKAEAEAAEQRRREGIESGEISPEEAKIQEMENQVQRMQEEMEANRIHEEVTYHSWRVKEMENEFVKETPDYERALKFVEEKIKPEILAKGYNELDVPDVLEKLELAYAVQMSRAGRNPVKEIYEQAKSLGFQPSNAATDPSMGTEAGGEGGGEAAKTGSVSDEAAKIKQKSESVRPKSLSNTTTGSSVGGGVRITTEQLQNMDWADRVRITDWLAENPDKDFQLETEGFTTVDI